MNMGNINLGMGEIGMLKDSQVGMDIDKDKEIVIGKSSQALRDVDKDKEIVIGKSSQALRDVDKDKEIVIGKNLNEGCECNCEVKCVSCECEDDNNINNVEQSKVGYCDIEGCGGKDD